MRNLHDRSPLPLSQGASKLLVQAGCAAEALLARAVVCTLCDRVAVDCVRQRAVRCVAGPAGGWGCDASTVCGRCHRCSCWWRVDCGHLHRACTLPGGLCHAAHQPRPRGMGAACGGGCSSAAPPVRNECAWYGHTPCVLSCALCRQVCMRLCLRHTNPFVPLCGFGSLGAGCLAAVQRSLWGTFGSMCVLYACRCASAL